MARFDSSFEYKRKKFISNSGAGPNHEENANFSDNDDGVRPEYYVELIDEPLVKEYLRLKNEKSRQNKRNQIQSRKAELMGVLDTTKNQLLPLLANTDNRIDSAESAIIKRQTYKGSVALFLEGELSDEQIDEIEKLPNVNRVEFIPQIKIGLDVSVSHINADDVWKIQDEFGNPITGAGKRVGVIDTGVDYTHPDLGGAPPLLKYESDKFKCVTEIVEEKLLAMGYYLPYGENITEYFNIKGPMMYGRKIAVPINYSSYQPNTTLPEGYGHPFSTLNQGVEISNMYTFDLEVAIYDYDLDEIVDIKWIKNQYPTTHSNTRIGNWMDDWWLNHDKGTNNHLWHPNHQGDGGAASYFYNEWTPHFTVTNTDTGKIFELLTMIPGRPGKFYNENVWNLPDEEVDCNYYFDDKWTFANIGWTDSSILPNPNFQSQIKKSSSDPNIAYVLIHGFSDFMTTVMGGKRRDACCNESNGYSEFPTTNGYWPSGEIYWWKIHKEEGILDFQVVYQRGPREDQGSERSRPKGFLGNDGQVFISSGTSFFGVHHCEPHHEAGCMEIQGTETNWFDPYGRGEWGNCNLEPTRIFGTLGENKCGNAENGCDFIIKDLENNTEEIFSSPIIDKKGSIVSYDPVNNWVVWETHPYHLCGDNFYTEDFCTGTFPLWPVDSASEHYGFVVYDLTNDEIIQEHGPFYPGSQEEYWPPLPSLREDPYEEYNSIYNPMEDSIQRGESFLITENDASISDYTALLNSHQFGQGIVDGKLFISNGHKSSRTKHFNGTHMWMYDIATGNRVRLTTLPAEEQRPMYYYSDGLFCFTPQNNLNHVFCRDVGTGSPNLADYDEVNLELSYTLTSMYDDTIYKEDGTEADNTTVVIPYAEGVSPDPIDPSDFYTDKILGGYDFYADSPDFMDVNGHGTHVSATAVGKAYQPDGLDGVARDAYLYGYGVCNSAGQCSGSAIAAAIEASMDPSGGSDVHLCQDIQNYDLPTIEFCYGSDEIINEMFNGVNSFDAIAAYNSNLYGGPKVIVIDMNATWCSPCYGSIPNKEDYFNSVREHPDLMWVTALVDTSPDGPYTCEQWGDAGEEGITPIINDYNQMYFNNFGSMAWPSFVVFDKQGRVIAKGNHIDDEAMLKINNALNDESFCDDYDGSNFDNHLDVINLSLGGAGDHESHYAKPYIDAATDVGVVVVAAVGNSGPEGRIDCQHPDYPGGASHSICCPGCVETAIGVGSFNDYDEVVGHSSRGPTWPGEYTGETLNKPDIVAPGYGILAAAWGGGHVSFSGTSMASPHVAGVAALILQANPNLSPSEVKEYIQDGAVDAGYDYWVQGAGRVDVYESTVDVLNNQIRGCQDSEACNYNADVNMEGYCDYGMFLCPDGTENQGEFVCNITECGNACGSDQYNINALKAAFTMEGLELTGNCEDGFFTNGGLLHIDDCIQHVGEELCLRTDVNKTGRISGVDVYHSFCYFGCMDETACNYNANACFDDGSCEYPFINWLGEQCTCEDFSQYPNGVDCSDVNNSSAPTLPGGIELFIGCSEQECEDLQLVGCTRMLYKFEYETDPYMEGTNCIDTTLANTYDMGSNCSYGSNSAGIYTNPPIQLFAECDDGSIIRVKKCGEPCQIDSQSECDPNIDGYGCGCSENYFYYNGDIACAMVGIDVPQSGCMDDGSNPNYPNRPEGYIGPACNYDSSAEVDDNSCWYKIPPCECEDGEGAVDLDNDGICDNEDDCIGEYDECDVCNGPGPMECWDGSFACPGDCPPLPTYGCTDTEACNYDEEAEVDDGTCYYPSECWDGSFECNLDDCPEQIFGCTDPEACNYNEEATTDDGSCTYAETNQCWDGSYSCPDDCPPEPISGCTDETACNYNEEAEVDDGSCYYPDDCGICDGPGFYSCEIYGFPDVFVCDLLNCPTEFDYNTFYINATSYSIQHQQNANRIRIYFTATDNLNENQDITILDFLELHDDEGTFDNALVNVNFDVTESSEWYSVSGDYTIQGLFASSTPVAIVDLNYDSPTLLPTISYKNVTIVIHGTGGDYEGGCMDMSACNYDPDEIIHIPNTCIYPEFECWDGSFACEESECPSVPILGCTDSDALNYNPEATEDDGSCEYVEGCTDPDALNYNPDAYVDDGSCIYEPPLLEVPTSGCTDRNACNFNPRATVDDGSCDYGFECWDGSFECIEADCPEPPIDSLPTIGCTNDRACNYNPNAEFDDGSCYFPNSENLPDGPVLLYRDCNGVCFNDRDNDNICDEEDSCVGELDECGVCNGPGAIYYCDTYGGQLICDIGNGGPYCPQDIPQNCTSSQVCLDGTKVCDLNDCPEVEPPESTTCIGTEIIYSGSDGWVESFPCIFQYQYMSTPINAINFGIRAVCQDGYVLMCNPDGNDNVCEGDEILYLTGHEACEFGTLYDDDSEDEPIQCNSTDPTTCENTQGCEWCGHLNVCMTIDEYYNNCTFNRDGRDNREGDNHDTRKRLIKDILGLQK